MGQGDHVSDLPDRSDPSDFSMDSFSKKCNHLNMHPESDSPLLPHGGYRHLRSYKVAEAVYDATVVFCRGFIPKFGEWRPTEHTEGTENESMA